MNKHFKPCYQNGVLARQSNFYSDSRVPFFERVAWKPDTKVSAMDNGLESQYLHSIAVQLPRSFLVPVEDNRTTGQSVTRAGAVQCVPLKSGGSNGKWQGRIHHATEPFEPKYRLLNVGRLTKVQKNPNGRVDKYKIVSNP